MIKKLSHELSISSVKTQIDYFRNIREGYISYLYKDKEEFHQRDEMKLSEYSKKSLTREIEKTTNRINFLKHLLSSL